MILSKRRMWLRPPTFWERNQRLFFLLLVISLMAIATVILF